MTTIFPTLTIEAAFIQEPGDGSGMVLGFTGDSGQLGVGTLNGPVFSDLTSYFRSATVTPCGRSSAMDRFTPGTVTVVFDNNSGDLDPANTDESQHPFILFQESQLQPLIPIRITATWDGVTYPMFYGFADAWNVVYTPGKYSDKTTVLTASDGMAALGNFTPTPVSPTGAGQTTGERIVAILNNAGWDHSHDNIDLGIATCDATTFSQSAADDIQNTVDSELGYWWIGQSGVMVFQDRFARLLTGFSATISDETDGYSQISRVGRDASLVRNMVTGQRAGGTAQTVESADSIVTYSIPQMRAPRSYANTSLTLADDGQVKQWAQLVLYYFKDALNTVSSFVYEPLGNPTVMWPIGLGFSVSDAVLLIDSAGGVFFQCFIEGITHQIDTQPQNWVMTFNTSCADKFVTEWLILGDADRGILGTGTLGA